MKMRKKMDFLKRLSAEAFSLTSRPFKSVARDLGVEEADFISKLQALKDEGAIRRIGAVLNHRALGLKENALVAWKVDKHRLNNSGKTLARFQEVTHCYSRNSHPSWPYNLYTMVHSTDKKKCLKLIKRMADSINAGAYKVLFTAKEFKKTRTDLAEACK